MKTLKLEYFLYLMIILAIWVIIAIKLCIKPNSDKCTIPLTDAKFLNHREKMNNVPADTIIDFYYQLVNIGENNLMIGYINPDCTCTECLATRDTIKPGDTTTIVMKFNTKDKLGFYKLNSVVKLNTLTKLYKISAFVNVVNRDSL